MLTNQDIATTQGDDTNINQYPQALGQLQTGVGAQDVHLIGDQYKIDIYNDLTRHEPYKTPLLTIVSALGSESWGQGPYITWNDDYNGKMWHDTRINALRLAADGSNNTAGKLVFQDSSGTDTPEVSDSAGIVTLHFDQADDDLIGSKKDFVLAIANLLNNAGYQPQIYSGDSWSDTSDGDQYKYIADGDEDYPIYIAFEDIAYDNDNAEFQEHEIIVKIKSIAWNTSDSNFSGPYKDLNDYNYTFVIELDFTDSNIENFVSDSTTVLFEEIQNSATTVEDGYTRISRLALISPEQNSPDGIAEGSNFSDGKGWNFSVQNIQNKCQIFQSDSYGITGTRQAAVARFFDEFQRTRERNLRIYKARQNAAFIRGVQSEEFSGDTGKPIRTLSGLLDYSTFPIKYMKASLDGITQDGSDGGVALGDWIDQIVYSVKAFREADGSDTVTFLASNWVLRILSRANARIGTSNGNIYGSTFVTKPPSKMTLGLKVYEYESMYGTVRFIHEPTFDLMPVLKASTATQGGVPSFLFSGGLNPRKILLAIDKKNIKSVVYRSDKIEGNIQDRGEDSFKEAMRGEKSFKLKFPRNFACVDVS